MMKLQQYVFIGLVIFFSSSLAFSKISFACYTGPEYQIDCCEYGFFDMGDYCCKTEQDCYLNNEENCRLNCVYRFLNPCEDFYPAEVSLNCEKRIDTLRRFRDEVLSKTPVGQEYIRLYYQWSPFIVQAMEEDEEFKQEVRELIVQLLPVIEAIMQ